MTELVNIVEVAQCRDKSDDRAQNAQRRRVSSCLREYRAHFRMTLFHDCKFGVQNRFDKFGIHAVNDHAQAVFKEGVVDTLDATFQSQNTFAPRQLRQFDESAAQ